MRLIVLSGLALGLVVVVVTLAGCSSDDIPTYEPPAGESSPIAQPVAQQTTETAESNEQPEQTAVAATADGDEEDQPTAQASQPEEPEAAQAQSVAGNELYVPVIRAHGSVSPAIIYTTSYDADNEAVWTRVSNRAASEGAVDGWLILEVNCWRGDRLGVGLRGLPPQESGAGLVRLQIDAGPVETQRWEIVRYVVGDVLTDVAAWPTWPDVLYQQLVNASTLTVEVLAPGVAETTFELAKMFTTPVEGNLQHCGRYAPARPRPVTGDYTPVSGTRGHTAGGVAWQAMYYLGRVIISHASAPAVADGADLGVLELTVQCDSRSGPSIGVAGLPSTDREYAQVPLQLDGRADTTSTWNIYDDGLLTRGIVTDPNFLFYDLLASDSISIDFTQLGLGPVTFDLSDAFTTPIQENLERCGQYHPIFHRELEGTYLPLERVGGELGPVIRYWAGLDEHRRVDSGVTITPTQPDHEESSVQLIVGCLDEWQPVVKLTGLPDTEIDSVTVDIRFGDADSVSAVWEIESTREGSEASSPRAELLQYLLRNATTLSIEIPELGSGPIQFDLTYLFKTPIQPNLDHCGG